MFQYNSGARIFVVNSEEVEEQLGELRDKAPAVIKVAANATAREVRKQMIKRALKRYAVNEKGKQKIRELAQKVKATNTKPSAMLYIGGKAGIRSDMAYFKHKDTTPHPGLDWRNGPRTFKGKVLKKGSMKPLTGSNEYSKAFLAKFASGHIGMIQRKLGEESERKTTANGNPRWKSRNGIVERTRTYETPSATAQHKTVYLREGVEKDAGEFLQQRLEKQIEKVLARAAAKKG